VDDKKGNSGIDYFAGPVCLALFAASYNAIAVRRKKPTISAGIRWISSHKVGTEFAGAVVGALIAHWFLKVLDAE
jgi:hypothetical protein